MPQIGESVKLWVKFYDYDNQPVNADGDVTLTIYDKEQDLIEEITTNITNTSVGEYEYDYTIPDGDGYLVYEYKCEIGGEPASIRKKLPREWVGDD